MALPLISETLPDILITDVKMPFMDGLELSRRVAGAMPWVKIVILSGHDEFEYAKQAIKIGVSEYLLKPVTSETLFQALESAAREIDAERERRRMIEGFKDIAPQKEDGEKSPPHGLKSSRYGDVIEKSREYIREHFAEGDISLNTVAEFVGLSPNHFSTVFSQETGETFIECLTRARIAKAKELLKTTSIRSSEIAYRVGYNDPHYFSYVFKKKMGVAPSEYRR
jgi:YesN/AraC family two-component response regulator